MTIYNKSIHFASVKFNYLTLCNLLLLSLLVQLLGMSIPAIVLSKVSAGSASPAKAVGQAATSTEGASTAQTATIAHNYGQLPLSFEVNQGQLDEGVKFFSQGSGYSFFLTEDEMVFSLRKPSPTPTSAQKASSKEDGLPVKLPPEPDKEQQPTPEPPSVVRMNLVGGKASPQIEGLDELPGKANYFIGNDPAKWHTEVATYTKVRYHEVYPGVDLVFYGNQLQLEYDFVVQPGADLSAIKLAFQGTTKVETNQTGDLVIHTLDGGDMTQHAPQIYQEIKGRKKPVVGRYTVKEGQAGLMVGFVLGDYDRDRPVTIDPVLVYSTYLGGSSDEAGNSIAVDGSGNAYVTGQTASTNFPTQNPFQATIGSGVHVFVTKLNPSGNALVYSTYLGGNGDDHGNSIAVDGGGNAYVTGLTYSTNFPTRNPLQTANGGGGNDDAFVAKLSSNGSTLLYSTYLGGSGGDSGNGIAVDGIGNAYVTGQTASTNFPTQNPFQATLGGSGVFNVFVAELSAGGSTLVYSTYLGGSSANDIGRSIAVDGSGNAYVTGYAESNNFPTKNPLQATSGGGTDAFVAKLNPSGNALLYSTYLGGSSTDIGNGIAVDSNGNAYIIGYTASTNFPTQNPFQATIGSGGFNVFVTKLNPSGNALVYSTYLGGSGGNYGNGIAVDGGGNAYITGYTDSINFPTQSPLQGTNSGGSNRFDAFVAKFSPSGSTLLYSTYLGGSGDDYGNGIAVDGNSNAYVTGTTLSTNFPTQNPFQATNAGNNEVFVTKLALYTPPSGPSSSETGGGDNPSQPNAKNTQGCTCDPVNTATGNFWHTYNDLVVPGRGIPLSFSHTYNSQFASSSGLLGFGWTFNYNMGLTQDGTTGNVTIAEEGGSQIGFIKNGSTYTPPPHTIATLVKNGDGTFTFTRRAREIFTFSAAGKLTKIQDLNGYITTIDYNSAGNPGTVTDSAGRMLGFTYFNNHLASVSDPANHVVQLGYDAGGNLTAVTDVNGGVTRFTYDANHLLLTLTDPKGGVTTNHYDAQNRVDWQSDGLSRKTTLAYQPTGTLITDPKGNATFEQYINGTRVAATKGYGTPQAATWTYTYDPATLGVTSVTDPNGHTMTYTYDASGNMLTATDPLNRKVTNTYDALNDLTSTTDPTNIKNTYIYDAAGNLLSRARPLDNSQNQVITYHYADAAHPGDITSMTDPLNHNWLYTYDTFGNQTSQTNPIGQKSTSTFNVLGWKLTSVSPKGNASGGNPALYTTNFAHDPDGLVTTLTDPLGHQTATHYDLNRNLDKLTDARGNVTRYTYDAANQLTLVTRPDSTTRRVEYNQDGTVWKEYDGQGQVTLSTYDPLSRLVTQTDPLGRTFTTTYDLAGNRLTYQDAQTPASQITTFGYDAANELTSITYSDGHTPNVSNITYNPNGLRTAMNDGTGTSTWTFDGLNRLTSYTNGASVAVGYGYDLKGQLTTLIYPGNKKLKRLYDDAGHWVDSIDWLNNDIYFGYDDNSNLSFTGGPVFDAFSYDQSDHLTKISYNLKGTSFGTLDYTRDANNEVISITSQGLLEQNKTYAYNSLNQLTDVNSSVGYYNHDAADNLSGRSGNSLQYDAANQLTTIKQGTKTLSSFNYDQRGNRTSQTFTGGPALNYTYDQVNRLVGYNNSTQHTYTYNGDGLRMSKSSGGASPTSSSFVWDTGEGLPLLLLENNTSYIYGPGGLPLEQISASGGVLYYHHDQLGSSRLLTDGTQNVVASYTYDEYGSARVRTGSVSHNSAGRYLINVSGVGNPFGYAGQYTDSETGLIYMRARYYDPATAQFLTRDPAVSETRQPYTYANLNPLNLSDPSGLDFDFGAYVSNSWDRFSSVITLASAFTEAAGLVAAGTTVSVGATVALSATVFTASFTATTATINLGLLVAGQAPLETNPWKAIPAIFGASEDVQKYSGLLGYAFDYRNKPKSLVDTISFLKDTKDLFNDFPSTFPIDSNTVSSSRKKGCYIYSGGGGSW